MYRISGAAPMLKSLPTTVMFLQKAKSWVYFTALRKTWSISTSAACKLRNVSLHVRSNDRNSLSQGKLLRSLISWSSFVYEINDRAKARDLVKRFLAGFTHCVIQNQTGVVGRIYHLADKLPTLPAAIVL